MEKNVQKAQENPHLRFPWKKNAWQLPSLEQLTLTAGGNKDNTIFYAVEAMQNSAVGKDRGLNNSFLDTGWLTVKSTGLVWMQLPFHEKCVTRSTVVTPALGLVLFCCCITRVARHHLTNSNAYRTNCFSQTACFKKDTCTGTSTGA